MEEQQRLAAAEAAANEGVDGEDTNPETPLDGKKGGKRKNQKKKKSNAQRKNNQKKSTQNGGGDLTAKMFATMEKHKEVFFTIRLHSAQSGASLGPITDPDPTAQCDLMDGRDAFLTLAREKHYEFSSLRRCKFSTMALLYELHTQGQDKFVYTCNTCAKSVETRYHCMKCEDFDLCIQCYEKEGHPHRMEKLGFDLDGGGDGSSNPQDNKRFAIQRCIQSLVHACQCRDANCRLPSCHKMKRVVSHTKQCKRKSNGGCPICKQLIALCCYHAKMCQEAKCPVPFCQSIKQKLKQQQLQQRLQEAAMMRRRIAQMNSRMNIGNTPPEPAQKPIGPIGGGQSTGGNGSSSVQPTTAGPSASGIATHNTIQVTPGSGGMGQVGPGGMRPVMNTHGGGIGKPGPQPGPGVLDAVRKVQEEAQRQSNQQNQGTTRFAISKPMNQNASMGPGQIGVSTGQQINSGTINNPMTQGSPMNVQQGAGAIMGQPNPAQWGQNSRFSSPTGHMTGQAGQQMIQQRMVTPQMQQAGQGGQQQKPTKQSLDQLLQALKSPNSEEQVMKCIFKRS